MEDGMVVAIQGV